MNRKIWILSTSLLIITVIVSGCGIFDQATETPTPTEPPPTLTATQEPTPTIKPAPMIETVPMEGVLNVNWHWAEVVELEPAAQSLVPNPENYTITFLPDSTFSVKADCNLAMGTYSADGGNLVLQLGPMTLAECGPESIYLQYLAHLENVSAFGMLDGRLVLLLGNEEGEMRFINAGEAQTEPPEVVPCATGIDPSSVTLDTLSLPYSYKPNCVPGTPYDDTQPQGPKGLPDHIQVNFGVANPQERQSGDPIIYIIPVWSYLKLWDDKGNTAVNDQNEQLKQLLRARPERTPTSDLPVLPFEEVTGTNDLAVQLKYLEINQGFGVRFVGRFAQGPNAVTNDNPQMFYIFQGYSSDGIYLISFFYPVSTESLPNSDQIPGNDIFKLNTEPQAYMQEKITELEKLAETDWEPTLTVLDATITSLQWGSPQGGIPGLTGVLWAWSALHATTPPSQSVVADPEKYTLVFQPDGNLQMVADCNSGFGTYSIDGENMILELGAMTQAECEPESLSTQYITLLSSVTSYTILDGQLVLNLADASRMFFNNFGSAIGIPLPGEGVATATALVAINVRAGPGINYPVYGVAPAGSSAEIVGISEDSEWWVIKVSNDFAPDGRGWVSAEFVNAENAEGVPIVPTPPLGGVILPTVTVPGTSTPPPNQPTAVIKAPKEGQINTAITFDASASIAATNITTYLWDFGDNTPQMEGITVEHTYSSAGTYTVSLTVIDANGSSHLATFVVTIS